MSKNKNIKTSVDSYVMRNSCALCGADRVEYGKIYRGRCVCSVCINSIRETGFCSGGIPSAAAAAESAELYIKH